MFSRIHFRNVVRSGFSLVELLVAVAIIALLAGISLAIMGGVMERQSVGKAKGQMQTIAQALDRYKARYHEYPAVDDQNTSYNALPRLTQALYGDGGNPPQILVPIRSGGGVDMELLEAEPLIGEELDYKVIDGNYVLVDPWGNPYYYFYCTEAEMENPPSKRTTWQYSGFILYSKGPDMTGELASTINVGPSEDIGEKVQDHFDDNESHVDDLIYGFEYK